MHQCNVGWKWMTVIVLVQVCMCKNEKSKGGKNKLILLLVVVVIFVKALHQEGHQIPNHHSITASHHILKHGLHIPFMFPPQVLHAEQNHTWSSKASSNNFPETESLCLSLLLRLLIFESLVTNGFFLYHKYVVMTDDMRYAFTSWSYVYTKLRPLYCTSVVLIISPSYVPCTAHFTKTCSGVGKSPEEISLQSVKAKSVEHTVMSAIKDTNEQSSTWKPTTDILLMQSGLHFLLLLLILVLKRSINW